MIDDLQRAKAKYSNDGLISLLQSAPDYITNHLYVYNKFYYAKKRYTKQYAKFGSAAPSPYKIIYISPESVDYMMGKRLINKLSMYGTHILSGDWENKYTSEELIYSNKFENKFNGPILVDFEKYGFYRSIVERCNNQIPWSKTEFHKYLMDNLGTIPKYYDECKISRRLNKIDELCQWMFEHGYHTQRELLTRSGAPFNPGKKPVPEHHEILINIGRDGKLIFEEGRHRFSVARAIGIDKIPVRICARHKRWQILRTEVNKATSIDDLTEEARKNIDHPDMNDVIGAIVNE